jgi:hypothetical protein
MFRKQFKADLQVVFIGRRKFKIENDTIHGNQQVQFVPKNRLFFGCTLPQGEPLAFQLLLAGEDGTR